MSTPSQTPDFAAPQWWLDLRQSAWNRYTALPLPARADERWRFSDLAALNLPAANLPTGERPPEISAPASLPPATPAPLHPLPTSALQPFSLSALSSPLASLLTFANNRLARRTPLPPDLAARGVIFCPLEEAIARHPQHIRSYLQKHDVALGSEKFTALNTALTTSGALLYVPKNVTIDTPFLLEHTATADAPGIYPHTLVILEDNARATLVETFAGIPTSGTGSARVSRADETRPEPRPIQNPDSGEATASTSKNQNPRCKPSPLACGVNDLHAGPGARLVYIGAQNWSTNTLAFQTNSIVAQRDARILTLNLHLGGRYARHESHSRLQGPGAHSEMLALTIASGAQQFDQRTLQTHQAPDTSSNLLYKNALLDTAKTIFSGLIIVEPDAQKTDAYQSNRNLMLSDEAEANSLPGLEIQANDVRCTHGATTARIPAGQEFYLKTRGINPARAQELLIDGFFEEVLAKLENEELQAALRALIQAKFQK
jgi:Fe-S cluster assembly protein SufD